MLSDLGMFSNIKKRIIKTSQEDDTGNNENNAGIVPPPNSSNNTSQENTEENTEINGDDQDDSASKQTTPASDSSNLINFDGIKCADFNKPFVGEEVLVVTSIPHPNRKTDESDNTPRHNGIDFQVASNTNIKPIYNGIVDKTGEDTVGYGKFVDIKHTIDSQQIITRYAHLSDTSQAETIMNNNNTVDKDSVIGTSGSTGTSTGAHLHLEIFKVNSKPNWEDSFTLLKCLIAANKVEITDPNVKNEYNELNTWILGGKTGATPRAGAFYRNNNSDSQQ